MWLAVSDQRKLSLESRVQREAFEGKLKRVARKPLSQTKVFSRVRDLRKLDIYIQRMRKPSIMQARATFKTNNASHVSQKNVSIELHFPSPQLHLQQLTQLHLPFTSINNPSNSTNLHFLQIFRIRYHHRNHPRHVSPFLFALHSSFPPFTHRDERYIGRRRYDGDGHYSSKLL